MELNFSLNSKPYYQNCGLKCLDALFQYYRIDKTPKDLIKKDTNKPLWISDLGSLVLGAGLPVTLFTYSQKIFRPEWFNFSKQKIFAKLRKREKNLLIDRARRSILDFLKLGGKLKFEVLNAERLKYYIKNKKPVLLAASSSIIHHRFMLSGHFVVLIGYDKKFFIILNPGRRKVTKEKINIDLLLYAFYQWGAWAMVVS